MTRSATGTRRDDACRRGERIDVDAARPVSQQSVQRVEPRVIAFEIVGANGGNRQHWCVFEFTREKREKLQRRKVGPMKVVEQHEVGNRHRGERCGGGKKGAISRCLRCCSAGREFVAALEWRWKGEPGEDLAQRCEGRAETFDARAQRDARALRGRPRRELVEQSGFSHACLAPQQKKARASVVADSLVNLLELAEQRLSTDERAPSSGGVSSVHAPMHDSDSFRMLVQKISQRRKSL